MRAFSAHPSSLDGPRDERISVRCFRVLRRPDVQHLGIVFPVMARMPGDLDCADFPGSRIRYNQESCGSALASTGRLFIASLSLQLHSLVDLLRVMEESLCNYQFHNPYFDARDRSSAH